MAVILTLRDGDGQSVSENCELFSSPKFFRFIPPKINWTAVQEGNDCLVTLSCSAFAWGVWLETEKIDCVFGDNGFFLTPDEPKTVAARNVRLDDLKANLTVTSVQELG